MASPAVVVAFSWGQLNPLSWLGDAAARVAADAWTAAMTSVWSAGLWLLEFVFKLLDAFTTPDLSAGGPLGAVLPTTLWLAAAVAGITFFVQIGTALLRRDGQSIGRVLIGTVQFGLVWVGYLGVAAAIVVAAGGLANGLLHSLLGIDTFAQFGVDASWPRTVSDAVVATVLGLVSFFLLLPASFAYLVIMLGRAAGLIVLAATAPVSAAGLLADATKSWFWKTLRWFLAGALSLPLAALVLGIGHRLTAGVVGGAGDQTVAAVGTAVVGAVLVAVGSVCPLVLFRLLAFVEPGTSSGAALRQSWAGAGGLAGVLSPGAGAPGGSSTATQSAEDGRSAGESVAEAATGSRFLGGLGALGPGVAAAARVAHRRRSRLGRARFGRGRPSRLSDRVPRLGAAAPPGGDHSRRRAGARRRERRSRAGRGRAERQRRRWRRPDAGLARPGARLAEGRRPSPGRSGRRWRRGSRRRRRSERGGRTGRGRGGTVSGAVTPAEEPVRFGEWSTDRPGWFLGLSGGAWVGVLLAGMPVLLAAGADRWLFALGWLPVWAGVLALVAVPVSGRPALRWGIDAGYRGVGEAMGWTRWRSAAAAGQAADLAAADLPGVLAGVRVHDGPPFGPLLARPVLVQHAGAGTWAVLARITHPGIGLAEPAERHRMAAGLAELTEAVAGAELVSVLALQVRTVPDDGAERAAWHARTVRPDAPPLALAVAAELAAGSPSAGVRHEVFVTVVVPEARIAAPAREAGGGIDGRARVLQTVMGEVESRLLGGLGAEAVRWLDAAALAAAIRTGFAPGEGAGLTAAALAATEDPALAAALPMAAAGPTAAPPPERRHYDHDAWSSVSCSVLLPDQGAVMGALAPVLTPTVPGERRSVTVFFEAIPRRRADRLVGRESMSADTAADLRSRLGFATRAAHRRDRARVTGQDYRLAAGRALVRTGMAAAVTVPSTWPVADFGRRLEASIRTAGFTPLRLDLAQDSGFAAAAIPLGVGLPPRRGRR